MDPVTGGQGANLDRAVVDEMPAAPAVHYVRGAVQPAEVTIRLVMTNHEPVMYGWHSRPHIPIGAAVTFRNSQPGSISGWRLGDIRVTGSPVRKDGTPAEVTSSRNIWSDQQGTPWVQAIVAAAQEELEKLLGSCTCIWAADSDGESGYIAEEDAHCPQHGIATRWRDGYLRYDRLIDAAGALFPNATGLFDFPPVDEAILVLIAAEVKRRADTARGVES